MEAQKPGTNKEPLKVAKTPVGKSPTLYY